MSELVSIREAARRLGVSDTAVHKAIKTKRVAVAGKTDSGRPLMDWADTERRWLANSDVSKRSHVGGEGSARRAQDAPRVKLATSDRMDENPTQEGAADAGASARGPNYANSRALREAYAARLAKLDFELRSGKLVEIDQMKIEAFKIHRRVRDAVLNIPDRCAPQLAAMTDAGEIHAYLLEEIVQALRQLSADIYAPGGG